MPGRHRATPIADRVNATIDRLAVLAARLTARPKTVTANTSITTPNPGQEDRP